MRTRQEAVETAAGRQDYWVLCKGALSGPMSWQQAQDAVMVTVASGGKILKTVEDYE